MNLILFEPAELAAPLPRSDPRAAHILTVLRRRPGDVFDAGIVNGPRGRGTLTALGADALTLAFSWGAEPPPPDPITLLLGLPRPQTARKILAETAALGVAALHFVTTEKSEPGYAQSTLWSSGEWRRQLLAGAAQAFCTRLPAVTHGRSLAETVAALPAAAIRLALDNYESPQALSAALAALPVQPEANPPATEPGIILAAGPERGWSAGERELLRTNGFAFAHLGARVLRVETAVVAAVAILKARLGRM